MFLEHIKTIIITTENTNKKVWKHSVHSLIFSKAPGINL